MKHISIKTAQMRLLATLLLFMGTVTANAQYYMNIRQTDGTKLRYAVSSVDSVWFDNNVHEYVDLGLSVKWATCNVGAEKPEDYGDYYAWGETETKTNYSWSTYKYCNGSSSTLTKYCSESSYGNNGFTDAKTTLDPEDDVAHVKWGGSWRMPTESEFSELYNKNNCTWTWTTQNSINGYLVTSKKSGFEGASIFLPAAGLCYDTTVEYVNYSGDYWSSSLSTSGPNSAQDLHVYSNKGYSGCYSDYRRNGRSVRPVCP